MTTPKRKTTKTRAKKTPNKQTISEFKAWLEGIEEVLTQDSDWYPNKEQWRLIRNRINFIVDSSEIEKKPVYRSNATPPIVPPSSLPNQGVQQQPGHVSVYSQAPPANPQPIPPDPQAAQMLNPSSPGAPKKTPDITSSEKYVSQFG